MYRLRVKNGRKWGIGRQVYTLNQAIERQKELAAVGIQTKIEDARLLFDGSVIYK